MLTRRCSERRFFLKPDVHVVQLVEYLLAAGCARYQMTPVAAVALSNHYHLVVHDTHGRWPEFAQWFNSLLARALNRYRGRTDAFWSADQLHVIELADRDAIEDSIAYVLANPSAAGLVERGRDWPGVRSRPQDYVAEPRVVERPDFFFPAASGLPESAALAYTIPPSHAHLPAAEFVKLVTDRVAKLEAEHRDSTARKGRRFLGVRAVKKQRWQSRPRSRERRGRRLRIRPEVKARDRPTRRAVLARIASFRRDYAQAPEGWRGGDRAVLFPAGTWLLRRRHGARCRPPP